MYKIRPMKQEDIAQVAAIEKKCFSQPWSEQAFADAVGKVQYIFVVAEEASRIIGYCGMYRVLEEGDITQVAVCEDKRRCGVARDMLGVLLRSGAEDGVEAYTLEVRVSNEAAVKLYEACGFVKESVRKEFYASPVEDAYIMWKR